MNLLHRLILLTIGCLIGAALVWPVEGQEPTELEPAPRAVQSGTRHELPDSVPAIYGERWWRVAMEPGSPDSVEITEAQRQAMCQEIERGRRQWVDPIAMPILDSVLWEMHRIPPPQCYLPWAVGAPYCGVTVGR